MLRIKSKFKKSRLVPQYTREMSWLTFLSVFVFGTSTVSQDNVYVSPDVNVFDSPYLEFEIPGSGDYIPKEDITKYNFQNINDILRNTPGVYTREEGGFGLFPNISLRGVSTLRSAKVTMMEDGINIAPAPYSAPDAYYSPLAAKMNAIEILKGSSQFRYGPHTTGGVINYVTSPINFGTRYNGNVSYGSFNDKTIHHTGNWGISGRVGAFGILGDVYYRENDGTKDFNGSVDSDGAGNSHHYGSDDAGGMLQFSPMVKLLWQLPTTNNITLELKGSWNSLDYNEGYTGLTQTDFDADPHKRYVAGQLDNMNSNAYSYYAKVHADITSNIDNNTTFYFNKFTRDWFKLDKVNNVSLQNIVSKAYGTAANLTCLKGESACDIKYKSNNRKYYAYGVMNQTNFDFNTDWAGVEMDHDMTFGFKYHYDKINRDQYTITYAQAIGGSLSNGRTAFDADRNQRTEGYAFYLTDSAKIDKWSFSLGGRYEYMEQFYRNKSDVYDKEEIYAFVSGGGLVYDFSPGVFTNNDDLDLFAGVYKGFSVPGPSSGVDKSEAALNQEKSLAKELGIRYSTPTIGLSLVGFHTEFDDFIVIDNSNAGGAPDNGGKINSKGLEFGGKYTPDNFRPFNGNISFYTNYTYTCATLDGAATTDDSESMFAGGRDGSNVPYIPEHVLSFGADYDYDKFSFGINMTYHSETYGTAEETETEESLKSANARAGRIDDAFLLNFTGGYKINENYSITAGVNNATDLEYISSRHPAGSRAGTPLSAWVKATANF